MLRACFVILLVIHSSSGISKPNFKIPTSSNIPFPSHINNSSSSIHAISRNNSSNLQGTKFCQDIDDSEQNHGPHHRVKRYRLANSKWEKLDLTWAVVQRSSKNLIMTHDDVLRELTDAFSKWSSKSKLNFQRVRENDPNIDIKIGFYVGKHIDEYPFDGPGGTLAHAFYPGSGGEVHFDDEEEFYTHRASIAESKTSFLVTATHELGHALGLHHSNDPDSLMGHSYRSFPESFDLPDDDTRAIQALYGRRESFPSHPPNPVYTTPTTTRRTTTQPRWDRRTTPRRPQTPPWRPGPTSPTRPYPIPDRRTYPPVEIPTTESPKFHYTCNPKSTGLDKPEICLTSIDAVTSFRGEIFFFKGKYFWRMRENDYHEGPRVMTDEIYPREFTSLFVPLSGLSTIDAVTSSPDMNNLFFFSGDRYYKINYEYGEDLEEGTLLEMGINASKIDAAMVWGHNGYMYLFSGSLYWRLNHFFKSDVDYPRDISVWRGVPENVSAILSIRDTTYFFSGLVFWPFNNLAMKIENPPRLVSSFWFGCPYHQVHQRSLCSGSHSLSDKTISSTIIQLLSYILLYFMINY